MQVIAIFKLVLILIHRCQFVREMHSLNRETCVLLVKIYWTKMSEMRNILHVRYYKIYGQLTLNAVHRLKFDDWKQFLRYIDTGITTFKPLFILFLMSSVHSVVFFSSNQSFPASSPTSKDRLCLSITSTFLSNRFAIQLNKI